MIVSNCLVNLIGYNDQLAEAKEIVDRNNQLTRNKAIFDEFCLEISKISISDFLDFWVTILLYKLVIQRIRYWKYYNVSAPKSIKDRYQFFLKNKFYDLNCPITLKDEFGKERKSLTIEAQKNINSGDIILVRAEDYMSFAETLKEVAYYDLNGERLKVIHYFPIYKSCWRFWTEMRDKGNWSFIEVPFDKHLTIMSFTQVDDYVTGRFDCLPSFSLFENQANFLYQEMKHDFCGEHTEESYLDFTMDYQVIVSDKPVAYLA